MRAPSQELNINFLVFKKPSQTQSIFPNFSLWSANGKAGEVAIAGQGGLSGKREVSPFFYRRRTTAPLPDVAPNLDIMCSAQKKIHLDRYKKKDYF